MPFNSQQKRYILEKEGLDPSLYSIDDNDNIIPITAPEPASSEPVSLDLPKEKPSLLETGLRAGTQSVIPTVVGAALARVPYVGIPLAIGGGIGASYLQGKYTPPEIQDKYFLRPQDYENNPWTANLGGLLPQLALGNPVKGGADLFKALPALGRAARNFGAFSKSLTPAEIATLKQAAIGSGIGLGTTTGVKLATTGELPTLPEAVSSVAGGALFNSPYSGNPLNRVFGLSPTPNSEPIVPKVRPFEQPISIRSAEPVGPIKLPTQDIVDRVVGVNRQPSNIGLYDLLNAAEANQQRGYPLIESANNPLPKLEYEPTMGATAIPKDEAQALGNVNSRIAKAQREEAIATQNAQDNAKIAEEKLQAIRTKEIESMLDSIPYAKKDGPSRVRAREVLNASTDPTNDPWAISAARTEAQRIYAETVKAKIAAARQKRVEAEQQLQLERLEKQLELEEKAAKNVSKGVQTYLEGERLKSGNFSPEDEAGMSGEIRYSKGTKGSETLTPEEYDYLKEIATRRGIAVESIPLPEGTKGAEQYSTRQVKIDPAQADKTTLGHEISHTWLDDLKNSTDPKDRVLAKDVIDVMAKVKNDKTPEENIADALGGKYADRASMGSVKRVVKDLSDYLGYKFGGNQEKALDILVRRSALDASYGTRPELLTPNNVNYGKTTSGTNEGRDERGIEGNGSSPEGSSELSKSSLFESRDAIRSSGSRRISEEAQGTETVKDVPIGEGKGRVEELNAVKGEDESLGSGFPILKSQVDKIASNKELGDKGKTVAQGFSNFLRRYRRLNGVYKDSFLHDLKKDFGLTVRGALSGEAKGFLKGRNNDTDTVLNYLDAASDGKPLPELTTKQQAVVDRIREHYRMMREDQNAREGFLRKGAVDPNYFNHTASPEVVDVILNKPNSSEAQKYHADFVDYVSNKIAAEGGTDNPEVAAEQLWQQFKQGYSKRGEVDIASQFGPIDKAEGYGLPESMRDKNLLRRIANFTSRTARRLAYYDAIQNEPSVNDALFGKEGISGAHEVSKVLDTITGVRGDIQQGVEAVNGIVKAMAMGTASGLRDLITTNVLGAQHADVLAFGKATIKAWANLSENFRESFSKGLNRVSVGALHSNDDPKGGFSVIMSGARRVRDIMNEVQGRQFLEEISRAVAYGQGKVLANDAINLKLSGKKLSGQQEKFLKDFAPGTEITEANALNVMKEAAARYTESVVGTYDESGLPHFTQEGALSPFFSLNRWNIEKANNFVKYVIKPMQNGNFKPLLNQSLWVMMLGAPAVEALNELLLKRKSQLPSEKELAATRGSKGNLLGTAYRFAGLASLGGFFGEVSNLAKMMLDKKVKNNSSGYQWIVGEYANLATKHVPVLADAISHGDMDMVLDSASRMLEDMSQSYRTLVRYTSEGRAKELERSDKFRDLKVFTMLDNPDNLEAPYVSNEVDLDKYYAKKFKREDYSPELYSKALSEALRVPDYESRVKNLSALKNNPTKTMPDPEKNPQTASRYYNFLEATQGKGEGAKRYADYIREKTLKKAKSSLVPTIR